jgi:hypothetical protein
VQFLIDCPSSAILKSVGLIYQRRKVHGAFATDALSLSKLPRTTCIVPHFPAIVTHILPFLKIKRISRGSAHEITQRAPIIYIKGVSHGLNVDAFFSISLEKSEKK